MALSHIHAYQEQPINMELEKELRSQITVGGLYQHYSGKVYKVIGIYRHTEELILYVAYEGQYPDVTMGVNWVRPLTMFLEKVEIKGVLTPRFKKIKD